MIRNKNIQSGFSEFPILLIVITAGIIMAGGLLFSWQNTPYQTAPTHGLCCDSGDGPECHPSDTNTFTYDYGNGNIVKYGLLRSNVRLSTNDNHLKDTGQRFKPGSVPGGDPILINMSDGYGALTGECAAQNPGTVQLRDSHNKCVTIPKDELIYVCIGGSAHCYAQNEAAPNHFCAANKGITKHYCYGDNLSTYNVYYKIPQGSTGANTNVNSIFANCSVYQPFPTQETDQQTTPQPILTPQIIITPYPTHDSLQLHTFKVEQSTVMEWMTPYCKPAIYLYPTEKQDIRVVIAPKGHLTLTIPQYPQNGWTVSANPNGKITDNGKTYNYLYYEAQIPDNLIRKQNEGYVVSSNDLEKFLPHLLMKLGLNQNENQAFTDYWIKALPHALYYQISIIPQSLLDTISPLSIFPTPQTILRVTLYFQALDKKISLPPPHIKSIIRSGFTVVEWGGMFKKDKTHNFTCLM